MSVTEQAAATAKADFEKYFKDKEESEKRIREKLQSLKAGQLKRATKYLTYAEKKHYLTN